MFRGVKGGHVSNVMHLVSCESNTGFFGFLVFLGLQKTEVTVLLYIFLCVSVTYAFF